MIADIIKFCLVDRKPNTNELYCNEDGTLYMCFSKETTNEIGWPGKKIHTIIPTLDKTNLSIEEMKDLTDFVWNYNIQDGTIINIKHSFEV